jgi:hypothetical protein
MNVTPYGVSVDSIDASHGESPNGVREFIPGLQDNGEGSSEIHYIPGGSGEALLHSVLGTTQTCRVVSPSGAYIQFTAFITSIEPEAPLDDKMVATVGWKISGELDIQAAAAPTNLVKPAISGVADEDEVLTAYEGVWDKEPTSFTYVWENAGTPIPGATGKTYTVTEYDAGDAITVVVTAINSAGSNSAESAAVTIAS